MTPRAKEPPPVNHAALAWRCMAAMSYAVKAELLLENGAVVRGHVRSQRQQVVHGQPDAPTAVFNVDGRDIPIVQVRRVRLQQIKEEDSHP